MIEDRLEKTFPGIRLSRMEGITDSGQRHRVLVQVPLMARLSREGTVALGDVYTPCIAVGEIALAGRPSLRAGVLVLDGSGGVGVVDCRLQAAGAMKDGAGRLEKVEARLRKISRWKELESAYARSFGKSHHGERLEDVARGHLGESSESSLSRLTDAWVDTIHAGKTALYLATERRSADKPSRAPESIAPIQKLLSTRSGGVFQVQATVTSTRPQSAYIEGLEEPARIIWAYRRKCT